MQRILVIEDDIDIQDILKNHLTDAGYEVVIADDGVAGIAKFDDTISLVLLDIMLPKIDGYGVCEVIRQKSQVPIIMLTALSDEENQLKGFEQQIDDSQIAITSWTPRGKNLAHGWSRRIYP